MKLGFFSVDKHKSFLQFDSITLGKCSQHAQSAQITSVQYPCNISKKKVKDKVYFLPAEKQRFLQVNTNILGMYSKTCPNYSK